MAMFDNDRLQEFFLVIGDKVALVNKKLWYALGITLVLLIPVYFLAKLAFFKSFSKYEPPEVSHSEVTRQPLQILEKKILTLSNNAYSGYVKIKNINLDLGVASQTYSAEFKTFGGTTLTKIQGMTFILPSSEKLLVFSRFSADQTPDEIVLTFGQSSFQRKPEVEFDYRLERVSVQNLASGLEVSAGIRNLTPFKIKTINLPVAVFNNQNQIVAVNSTNINDVGSGETRTFQYLPWPAGVFGAQRAEIYPEINIFDPSIFSTEPGVSPFDNQ